MFRTSNEIGDLAAAVARAQEFMESAIRGGTNPNFNSRYADLGAIRRACIPALAAQGVAVFQAPTMDPDGRVSVTTRFAHASGQWMESTLSTFVVAAAPPHVVGSATTYLSRYGLAAMAGVALVDDDGNLAQQSNQQFRERPQARNTIVTVRTAPSDPLDQALEAAFNATAARPQHAQPDLLVARPSERATVRRVLRPEGQPEPEPETAHEPAPDRPITPQEAARLGRLLDALGLLTRGQKLAWLHDNVSRRVSSLRNLTASEARTCLGLADILLSELIAEDERIANLPQLPF